MMERITTILMLLAILGLSGYPSETLKRSIRNEFKNKRTISYDRFMRQLTDPANYLYANSSWCADKAL